MPSPRRLLVIAHRCLRFPPRSGTGPSPTPVPRAPSSDARWLLHFSLIVLGLGLIAILTIALLLRG